MEQTEAYKQGWNDFRDMREMRAWSTFSSVDEYHQYARGAWDAETIIESEDDITPL